MSTSNEEPPAKRQKRSLGASDRITVDVGGTKFITSVSTLTSNSAYFASLLSDNWIQSNNGDDEIFIDQDPVPFGILLAYMRRGNIKVRDIDTDVLALAEFLGIERLLLAVKIRWYYNIGKGPVFSKDEEIAAAFDHRYGGIMKAVSAGLFQYFLKQDDIYAEKDFAKFTIMYSSIEGVPRHFFVVKESGETLERISGPVGALNGLHQKGYTNYESQLHVSTDVKETFTSSRRKHSISRTDATDILIPDDNERCEEDKRKIKQFAMVMYETHDDMKGGQTTLILPAEFNEDESERSNPFQATCIIETGTFTWLEDNGFTSREEEYEIIFQRYLHDSGKAEVCKILSRMIERENGDNNVFE